MMELHLVCRLGKYFVSLNTSIFHFFFLTSLRNGKQNFSFKIT